MTTGGHELSVAAALSSPTASGLVNGKRRMPAVYKSFPHGWSHPLLCEPLNVLCGVGAYAPPSTRTAARHDPFHVGVYLYLLGRPCGGRGPPAGSRSRRDVCVTDTRQGA
jgi:hypothetical protein